MVLTQGTAEERRFVAVYGQKGRIVAALAINAPLLLPAYQALIEARAPFPPELYAADGPLKLRPVSAGFPPHGHTTHSPGAVSTGPGPSTPEVQPIGKAADMEADPRIPLGPKLYEVGVIRPTIMTQRYPHNKLFEEILNPANRHNPYPLYAQLRETPISQQEDGTYVVSTIERSKPSCTTHASAPMNARDPRGAQPRTRTRQGGDPESSLPFILLDPPDHNRLRRVVMHQFTPERVEGMREIVSSSWTNCSMRRGIADQLDIVDDFAHPLPVRVISEILGLPAKMSRASKFGSAALTRQLEPQQNVSEAEVVERGSPSTKEMKEYLAWVCRHSSWHRPGDDLISGLVVDDQPRRCWTDERKEILASLVLLIVAGYETTVNLITNGMLTPVTPSRCACNDSAAHPTW